MEDEERQKKLEAGKAKLAEYRQRKAYADSQKKQKKKKKKRSAEDSEGDSLGRVEVEPDQSVEGEKDSGGGRGGPQEGNGDPPSKEFTFTRTLRSGETVKHDQTYTIEPESEISTTAEDCSSEEEVDTLQQVTKGSQVQDMEEALAAKTRPVDEFNQELEEMGAAFGAEEVQQLQDFEAALNQRDGIITQLTANLQQAREEKDEIMREFLELTQQSQKLQIQFQQLQAGETLRNTSHSSTAADLLLARQEMNVMAKQHQEKSGEQLEHIRQLEHKLSEIEMSGRRSEESFAQRINEKDLLIAEHEKTILSQEQSLTELQITEDTFAQTLKEKNQFICEQTAIITEHELSLTLLRKELAHVGQTTDKKIIQQSDEKDLIIAERERVISERDCSLAQLADQLESSEKHQRDLRQRVAAKELELERCADELESTKSNLESCKSEMESCTLELEKERTQLEFCKGELATSRQKERLSSNEIMQLMGTVEDLQKRYHQGNLSESDTIQKMQEDTVRKLELLRAELDEMYGQQIVQMKQELNLRHAASVEQITVQHLSELELLKAQLLSESSAIRVVEVSTLHAQIRELQETSEQSQAMHGKARHELNQVTEEKINLQAKVDSLLQELRYTKDELEQVSHSVVSRESQQCELLHLQETIDDLKRELTVSREAAEEAEAKHDSEITNYQIKLQMLEREKDAVLDRMAQSLEAELERLRTRLLFSHEEELTNLREDLQRESFLNAENLLNEAAVKHEKALDELRVGYEETLRLSQRESASVAAERDELLRQIGGLKEDLKLALHGSKADELVQQLQELQVELEELRKGEEQAQMENQIQTLLKKTEVLENRSREQEQCWEKKWKEQDSEKEILIQSNNTLKEDLDSKIMKIETLTAEKNQIHQQLVWLSEEMEKQRTTFSFAKRNFEVNCHELKEEYACLIETKTRLEERTLKETLEFEAKIASLQSQIRELEESRRDIKTEETNTDASEKGAIEKDATELMEKLNVTLSEKKGLAGRLSEITEQLMFTESKLGQLEDELSKVRQENANVKARNESLKKELNKKPEIKRDQAKGRNAQRKLQHEEKAVEPVCPSDDHRLQIQSLQEQIKTLQSLLQAAESERDGIRRTLELQRLSQTPSPAAAPSAAAPSAAAHSSREGSVEGQSSPHKPTASGSSRHKRRQRSKQERKVGTAPSDCRDGKQREEEEEEAAAEEGRAASAAESEARRQVQSQLMSRSQERTSKEDSTDGCQGDEGTDHIHKWVKRHGTGHHMEPVECPGPEEEGQTTEHGECRLQIEAQRISLSQIHAAQLELLQEETDARTRSLELKLQNLKDHDEPKIFKHRNVLQAVSDDCSEIIQSFQKIFGEDLIKTVDAESRQLPSMERPETSESTSVLLEARELYRDLQKVRETIEQEHLRLSRLQALLRADGNKMTELQTAYEELRSSSEKEILELRVQVASMSPPASKDPVQQAGSAPSTCPTEESQRLRAEEQEKQRRLEESHGQEVERLRDHYRQQAAETEERYLTELFVLQRRLQEVAGTQTHFSVTESSPERMEEHTEELLKDPSKEELSEGDVESHLPARSAGLTAQLQALRTALSHKYAQEVTALKEQHSRELKRLREERPEPGRKREERRESGGKEQDPEGVDGAGRSVESLGAAGQAVLEERQDWERVEEEVAKTIVQMSVKFAQQTELAQINKRASQTCSSMQTQLDEDEAEERESEERTPGASLGSSAAWPEEAETERLGRELQERDAEIRKLKEELRKTESAVEQTLKKREDGPEDVEGEPGVKQAGRGKLSPQDDGDSFDQDSERNALRKANKKLSRVLVEVLKTTAAAEETMGLHMKSLGVSGGAPHSATQRASEPLRRLAAESCQGSETGAEDVSLWSGQTEAEEGLEMGTQLEHEEYLMGISSRLQTALENMLMAITDTTNQLEHARMTQTELMRESFRHNQEMNDLLQRQEELQESLSEEARAREQLALELHRAEGVIDGYTDERASLEEQLRQKGELQLSLEQELQVTGSRLQELEQERHQMLEERELLSRQQDAMRESAGPRELRLVEAAMVAAPEADLLEETEKLMKEKVEVQRQAEKENTDLLKQVKLLEAELEEQVNRVIELEQAQRTESGDLRQQVQALEKQLEKNRRFLDEQAVDREHERDFFQQEIHKLEQQLKSPQKLQAGSEKRNREVDQLTSQLKEKADWCSELLLSSEQLRRELGERDEEIDKLEGRIRELEQALLASAESQEKVEQKKQHASITEAKHSTLESQLQTEREALERKEKEICNLEEQLEQFREELENKSEEVQQLEMQLEIQSKEISSQQEHLETRDSLLRVMEEKDREIALLNEQITKPQHTETASDNKGIDDRDELIKDLESQVQCLQSEQERLKRNSEEELDQLNAVIDKLQQELANIEQKQSLEEYEDNKPECESYMWGSSKNDSDESKQRMDLVTKELDTLKAEHSKLLETYLHLKERTETSAETEGLQSSEAEREEALREKTAGFLVMQAQIQALERSATSRVEELDLRIRELEDLVDEKDCELRRCRLLAEQTQSNAEGLQRKVSNLETNLREKVAAVLVSQATLEAFQQQHSQRSKEDEDRLRRAEPSVYDFCDYGIPQTDFGGIGQAGPVPTGKVVHLSDRLRELAVGLSGIQKDQELQKQLLSSSEEEVLEYERRLSVLMDLLGQMKAGTHQRISSSARASSAHDQPAVSDVLRELQEVREEVSSTKEQLDMYKESCSRLQEELKEKTVTIEKLQDQLQEVSSRGSDETKVSELHDELTEARNEAASTKEELNSCRESLEKLQELLQEREMTIAHLKAELFQAKDEDIVDMAELLQEVRNDAASTKEELNSCRQHNEKLQQDLRLREVSISELKGELQEMRRNVDIITEELNIQRQYNEKLQEDLQAREFSISELKGELQDMRQNEDTTKEELDIYKQHNDKLQQELQLREDSISKLNGELQEMRRNVDTITEELNIQRQYNEKLQEDLQLREDSISKLSGELQEMRQNEDTTKEEFSSHRQHHEKLQDELHVRESSISKLKGELQEMRQNEDTTKEELDIYKQHNEKLQQELQLREDSISELKGELQEMRQNVDTITEELNIHRQHNEKLQEDLQLREDSISKLNGELQEMRQNEDTNKEEFSSHRQHHEKLQDELHVRESSISKLSGELQEMRRNEDTTKEELDIYKQNKEKLQQDLQQRDNSISELKGELQEMRQNEDTTKEELDIYKQHNEKLQQELQLREDSISKLNEELQEMRQNEDITKEEFSSHRQHHEKLQNELQVRELSISKLSGELQEMRQNEDTTKEEFSSHRQHNEKLQQELQLREDSISKLNGELQEMRQKVDTITEELNIHRQHNEKLQDELQEMRQNVDTITEELSSHRQHNEKLQDELQVRELSISKLKEDLKEVRTASMKTADSVPPSPSPAPSPSPSPSPQPLSSSSSSTTQPKRKGGKQLAVKGSGVKDKPPLSKKSSAVSSQSSNKSHSVRLNSSPRQRHLAVTHASTQTEPLQMSDLDVEGESPTKEEMEEMVGEFQEKIAQMQELHAAEILDMEARHISESESLRRDTQALEDECKALKTVIDKLRSAKVVSSRQDRPTSLFKDGYTSDSSSDYSQRPGSDLPSLQQELRTTPEGARRETDDPLPDRIKTLLREVHQEGMQVLSLSELPLSEEEPGNQFNVQDWVKERDDLLATVESLKRLITHMQTNRETQTPGGEDWRSELLDAVRQVFMRERCVLKSALYSQLDQLDTSDAIIHLNQLEHRLAEQDVQHREAMASLRTAERSSLISEIHHLRGQLEQIHQGALPALSAGGECSWKEQSRGGRAGGSVEDDRLLLEELKCELSQTKLELETTLRAQHKHLKELDALRAEVSQKAAEVESFSDQLTEERKRSRDLQWAMEREKCRTGRDEESKREEVEDLQLSLEEEKGRVAQLTLTLEQERQASSRLSRQAEEERLSLHRRLHELQVQLESERAKTEEMSTALGREKELRMAAFSESGRLDEVDEEASLLERLQTELEDKHLQVVHLLGQVAAQKLEVLRKEEELTAGSQRSKQDREALLEARAQLRTLEARMSETQEQLKGETERRKSLEEEKERLELNQFRDQRGREASEPLQADGHTKAVCPSDSTDRTKDWVFQQKSGNVLASSSGAHPLPEVSPTGPASGPHHGPWRTADKILSKLHLISSKVRGLVSKTTGRPMAEVDSEDLSWVLSNIDEVITMLQQSPGLPAVPESVPLPAGGSSNSLTERLLRQNAELTGFVSRLTEEKNDLRNHTLRLEEEVRRHRQAGLRSGESLSSRRGVSKEHSSGALLSQEQEAWTREKARLEKALHLAQAQVARLRGEIRSDTLREMTGPEADNAALKRMYGKYLRSESFRKALIYQKKYLLLLLGGFQECEEATLSLLCRMGGRPSLESLGQRRRGLTRFRSAVRVSIALSRMRFLVKRWHRVTGMSSLTCSINKNGAGQTFDTDVRDSPYLHPGSVEMYRERGGGGGGEGGVSGSRGRSESPRSAVSSTHHRFHLAGDHGPLTCSHLQNYDPDRALTDYISRLEALQRRLGTVTSGASSYGQLHFGLRR